MCKDTNCCCGSKHQSKAEDRQSRQTSCGCGTGGKDQLDHLLKCRQALEAKLSTINARIAELEN